MPSVVRTIYNTVTSTGRPSLKSPALSNIPYPTHANSTVSTTSSSPANTSVPPQGTASAPSTSLTRQDESAGGQCPGANNTLFTTTGFDQYQVQRYRRYSYQRQLFGVQGLDFPDCVEECSLTNQAFAEFQCFGITWVNTTDSSPQCNLKTRSGLVSYVTSEDTISAILLSGVNDPIGLFGSP